MKTLHRRNKNFPEEFNQSSPDLPEEVAAQVRRQKARAGIGHWRPDSRALSQEDPRPTHSITQVQYEKHSRPFQMTKAQTVSPRMNE